MVKSLDLAQITALADSGAYGGNRVLSPTSSATILCAGVWLSDLGNWQGAGYDLTEEEIDEIEELVAELQFEIMTEGEAAVSSYTKIAETVITSPAASVAIDNFDSGDFQAYELWVSGLKGNGGVIWIEDVKLRFNEDDTAANYFTFGQYQDIATQTQYQAVANYSGFRLFWVSSTAQGVASAIGHFKLRVYAPQVDDNKYIEYRGTSSYPGTNYGVMLKGTGIWSGSDDVEHMEIFPDVSSLFDVDPGESDAPSELRMTLYGLG